MRSKGPLVLQILIPATALGLTFLFNCPLLTLSIAILGLLAWAQKSRANLRSETLRNRQLLDQQALYFKALADTVLDLLCIQESGVAGAYYFNQRWSDYTGCDPKSPQFWAEIIHPEDLLLVQQKYELSISTFQPFQSEFRIRKHDGSYRWHLSRGTALKKEDGTVGKWVAISTDIHDQKLAEAERQALWDKIEEKTKMFTTVLDQMPSGVIISRPDRHVILKNRKAVDFFSLKDDYQIGTLEGYHEDGSRYQLHEWPMVRALETGFSSEEEIYFPDGKGGKRCYRINAAPIYSDTSKIIAAACIVDDLTDYKEQETAQARRLAEERAAAEIKRSQEMLEMLFENIPAMILIKDAENLGYVKVNRFAQEILGKSEKQLLGKTSYDLMSEDLAKVLHEADRETVKNEKVIEILRHEVMVKGDEIRHMHTKKFVFSPGGGRKLLVFVSYDITDIVSGEKQIIHAREQAEQVARLKSEFLANMSHEIRTPLNGVIGMTELLMDTQLDEQQEKLTSIVQDSGKVLLTIVNDILDFSKIEAGQLDLETIEFDPRRFFTSQLDVLKIRAEDKGLKLTCVFDQDFPHLIKGDPGRVGQILMNLIGNAIKFTASGGVAVRGELHEKKGDEVTLRFLVTDTGIGLTRDERERLFKPFVQADGSFARRYGGTGLGLSICKKLAEMMEGTIEVESKKDEGSTFWFTAKLQDLNPSLIQKPKQGIKLVPLNQEIDAREKHILVAEDNTTNQILAIALLKKMGYVPHVVANGLEVLDAIQKFDYDLILMDCQMPELDGYEATLQIRELEKTKKTHIPIIALTANAMKEDREKCLTVGMDDFVSKPIKRDLLEAVLKNWTSVQKQILSG